jgi:hypothetical protein
VVATVGSITEATATGLDAAATFATSGQLPNLVATATALAQRLVMSKVDKIIKIIPGGKGKGKTDNKKPATKASKKADNSESGGTGGVRVERLGGCRLRPYEPDTCKAEGKTGHHVVPDRAFRLGPRTGPTRQQIGLSEADGLVVCVEGATPTATNQHGKIHRLYDPMEKVIGLAGKPPGTAPLAALEAAGAAAVGKITGCNPASLMAQLRAYHQTKDMGPDFKVRADKRGFLARKLPKNAFGVPGPGDF